MTDNPITQPKRFKPGQRVKVQLDYPSYSVPATIREVEKGEEDWKYYVNYQTRDYRGLTGGVHFAEEIEAI